MLKAAGTSAAGAALLGGNVPGVPDVADTASATHNGEPYRPDYRFSPENGWMNDPNGMVYDGGTYHLFYQAGENRRRWDHATSTDLVNWTEHGTKIPDTDTIQAFSGGAVLDKNNTAGFGENAIVCMYTGHHDDGSEDQRLAYSTDGGDTFTKYSGNPVIDTNHDDWRDPQPFWYDPAGEWRMVIARVSSHSYNGTNYPAGAEVWRSSDLKNWEYLDTYESGGAGWECPDLYKLPVSNTSESRWVMNIAVEWDHCETHIGHFDGTMFTADYTEYADSGRDFYGGQSWDNEPSTSNRLYLAWMNHWDYAMDTPDNGWKGVQSFPRRQELYDTGSEIISVQRPDVALEDSRTGTITSLSNEPITGSDDPLAGTNITGPHLEMDMEIDPGDADQVELTVRSGGGQETLITFDQNNEELVLDRNNAGNFFGDTGKELASQPFSTMDDGNIMLHVLVDGSVIEIFGNDGRKTMSNQVFPDSSSTGTSLLAKGGTATLVSLDAYAHTSADGSDTNSADGLVDGGTYRIENLNSGKVLEVKDGGTSDGDPVQQWEYLDYDHQKWVAHEVAEGRYWFENVNSGKALDVEDASTDQGATTMQWGYWSGANQHWDVHEVADGVYHPVNVNSGWSLDVDGASTDDGARGQQWEWWAGDNQKWRFERLD